MSRPAATTIDLDAEMNSRLLKLAADRKSAPRALLKEAVEQYVDREEKRQAFHADGRKAWEAFSADGLHLTEEEAAEWLDRLAAGDDVDPPKCHG